MAMGLIYYDSGYLFLKLNFSVCQLDSGLKNIPAKRRATLKEKLCNLNYLYVEV